MAIGADQIMPTFTQDLIDVYSDRLAPTSFLRSFFPSEQSFTRYVMIAVKRYLENVAVDVLRGTGGNRNKFEKSTLKTIDPPFYKEYFDMTEIDLYDRVFGSTRVDEGVYGQFLAMSSEKLAGCQDKIERAIEVMAASVLTNGQITLTNADSINYGRQAGSMVDKGAGNYWATGTVNPFTDLENACIWLRQEGKAGGDVFNAILGAQAFRDMQTNTIYKERVLQNLNNNIDMVLQPQRNSVGGTYHGTLSCGTYKVNIWTYNQYYDLSGTSTAYLDTKQVIVLPENPRFKTGFAAVPQLPRTGTGAAVESILEPLDTRAFVPYELVDNQNDAHIIGIKSAPIVVPTAVDQIYTVQVVAA